MQLVVTSFGRALLSQLHFRMLLLTVLPFVLSLLLWGVVLWLGLQPMIDWLHAWFADNNLFQSAASVLGWFGLGTVKTVLVPLIESLWLQFGPFMRLVYEQFDMNGVVDQHERAIRAIEVGDAARLRAAIEADIGDGMSIIGKAALES